MVSLLERRLLYVESVGDDPRQRAIVQNDLTSEHVENSNNNKLPLLTTESAFCVNRLIAKRLLYGFTTTSADCVSGKTEYVWMSFLGKRSFIRSRR